MKNLLRLAVCFIAVCLLTAPLAAQPLSRSVLLLDQSSAGLPFNTALATALRLKLIAAHKVPISFYNEHLDANRFFGPDYEADVLSFFRRKYRDKPIDIIVVVGAAALDFVTRRRAELWPNVPVVFTAIDEATITQVTIPHNVTGVTMQLTLQDMVKVASIAMPNLKRVAIVGDPLERQTFYRHFKEEIPTLAKQVEIVDLMNLSMDELKRKLGTLPDATAFIYTGIYFDKDGISYVPAELVVQIAEWANRPVVVNVASYLGKGALGGYIVRPQPLGEMAAQIALSILDGANASDLPVTKVSSPLIFEWPALQRWRISESRLPPESEIYFREPKLWQQYFWTMVAISAVLAIQTALIAALFWEDRRRRRVEANAQVLMDELAHTNRIATAGQLTASIAHEIRQPLAAIASFSSAGLNWLKRQPPNVDEVRDGLESIKNEVHRIDDVIKNVNALFKNESTTRTEANLNTLVRQVLTSTARAAASNGIVLETNFANNPPPYVMANPGQLQQVILNLIMNAIEAMSASEHGARMLFVETSIDPTGSAVITVADSGPGFDPNVAEQLFKPFFTTKSSGMGLGLPLSKSVIEAHNGRLTVASREPRGSAFQIVLPCHRHE